MRKTSATLATSIGLLLAFGLLLAAAFAAPGGAAQGAALQPATPSVTVDPGRGTPGTGPATPTPAATARTPTPTPTPTPRRGTLTVSPSPVSAGAPLTVTGSGFSANAPLAIAIEEDADGSTAAYVQPAVDASGNFTRTFDTSTFRPGPHTVTVLALPNANALASATFTVAGMPGLPNTGEGVPPSRMVQTPLLLGGLALIGLAGLAALALRRRLA